MIFDNKRAEVGAKGMDSHKAVAEVEADVEVEGGGLQWRWWRCRPEVSNGGNKWPVQHWDIDSNWRAEKLFRNFAMPPLQFKKSNTTNWSKRCRKVIEKQKTRCIEVICLFIKTTKKIAQPKFVNIEVWNIGLDACIDLRVQKKGWKKSKRVMKWYFKTKGWDNVWN